VKLSAIKSRIRNDIQHFGVAKAAYAVGIKGINMLVDFRILNALKIEEVNPDLLESGGPYQWQFLAEDHLRELAKNPENKLSQSLVETALGKGDECYGALDGDELACYGWYSNSPTFDNGLTVHFSPEYIYMYAGATQPKYRGQRLHAIGMNRALREYLARGFKGLVSYVDSHNFSSLKSVYRMGYRDIGRVVALKLGNRVLMHTSRGCREHGVYMAKACAANQPEPEPALIS
jgi:hypothetical protein